MPNIPDDVMKSAHAVVAEMMKEPMLAMGPFIARAIMAEREKCNATLSAQVQDVAVAEIVSAHGDPEAFGERELVALVDIQKFPYRTKLYAAAPANPGSDRLLQIHQISAEIIASDAWREHWEPDYAGGSNVRAKIKRIIELSADQETNATNRIVHKHTNIRSGE